MLFTSGSMDREMSMGKGQVFLSMVDSVFRPSELVPLFLFWAGKYSFPSVNETDRMGKPKINSRWPSQKSSHRLMFVPCYTRFPATVVVINALLLLSAFRRRKE